MQGVALWSRIISSAKLRQVTRRFPRTFSPSKTRPNIRPRYCVLHIAKSLGAATCGNHPRDAKSSKRTTHSEVGLIKPLRRVTLCVHFVPESHRVNFTQEGTSIVMCFATIYLLLHVLLFSSFLLHPKNFFFPNLHYCRFRLRYSSS